MKRLTICLTLFLYAVLVKGQILPGALDVTGAPLFSQNHADLVSEAGEDDNVAGFESAYDATLLSFILDESTDPTTGVMTTSESNCSENVYRYSVFVHTLNVPEHVQIEVKTNDNSGSRYPATATYDDLMMQPLGPRDLRTENGGAYILIPNDPNTAIKILEFIGCRADIPLQFRIKPGVAGGAGTSQVDIYYTVVGSLN